MTSQGGCHVLARGQAQGLAEGVIIKIIMIIFIIIAIIIVGVGVMKLETNPPSRGTSLRGRGVRCVRFPQLRFQSRPTATFVDVPSLA